MYKVLIYWNHLDKPQVQFRTYDSIEAKEYTEQHISFNAGVMNRVEIHDNSGCVETVWDRKWENA
jgi:hypothetical protein